MFGKKTAKVQNRIDSLIGAGTVIIGDVTFSGGLRVDGEIIGNVGSRDNLSATLVVSENARIQGSFSLSHVVVNAAIIGTVQAPEILELQAKARVTGDVEYTNIEIHLGAVIQGRLVHQAAPAKTVELKLASKN